MDLAQYLYPLKKWWWLLVVSVVLAAVSSYFVVSRQPLIYEATATLLIGSAFTDPNPTDSELYLGQQLARTYAHLGLRRPIREQTRAALGLDFLPTYAVLPVPNSQLLEISVTTYDPALGQSVANELANQLILQSPTALGPEELERRTFVNDQLNTLQERIQETEEEIARRQQELEEAFSAREIADLQEEITGLQSKQSSLQDNYSQLLSGSEIGAVNTLALIEPAPLPQNPVGPARMQTVLTTVVVALTLAAGTAYLLEYLDDTIKSSDDVIRACNLPSLPDIPMIKSQKEESRPISLVSPLDLAVDAFRVLRTVMQFRIKDIANPTILVTSTMPEDGKSTVAANLAVVISQAGSSVLLVDADVRRPSQHKLFKLSNGNGFKKFLLNYKPNREPQYLEELLETCIEKSSQENLWLMQSGFVNKSEAKALEVALFEEVLRVASSRFDYIIIDSSPLLATSDALAISGKVDGVILLVRAGVTRRKDLKHATTQLQMIEANVLGVTINQATGSSAAYAYKYSGY